MGQLGFFDADKRSVAPLSSKQWMAIGIGGLASAMLIP